MTAVRDSHIQKDATAGGPLPLLTVPKGGLVIDGPGGGPKVC
jgi:hypothetical protein